MPKHIIPSRHDGYKDAAKIDETFSGLSQVYEPSKPENVAYWLALLRTVRTTLDLIEIAVKLARKQALK